MAENIIGPSGEPTSRVLLNGHVVKLLLNNHGQVHRLSEKLSIILGST